MRAYRNFPHETLKSINAKVNNYSRLLGGSGKNMLKIIATSTTKFDVEFTINNNGTVTVSGTATEYAYLKMGEFAVEAGKSYRISGCPIGGNSTSGFFVISQGASNIFEIGEGIVFEATQDEVRTFYIGVRQGCTADNLIFKPMVTDADIIDQEFEIYTNGLSIETKSIDNYVVTPHNVGTMNFSINSLKRPLAIAGVNFSDASDGGVNSSNCRILGFKVNNIGAEVTFINDGDADAKIRLEVNILTI